MYYLILITKRHIIPIVSDKASNKYSPKKLKFDNSLLKTMEFDDLLTGGKPSNFLTIGYGDSIPNEYSLSTYISSLKTLKINEKLIKTTNKKNYCGIQGSSSTFIAQPPSRSESVKPANKIYNRYMSTGKVNPKVPDMTTKVRAKDKTIKEIKEMNPPKNFDRLNKLYTKGKETQEKLKNIRVQNYNIDKMKESTICTFKPNINRNYTPIKKSVLNKRDEYDLYQRHIYWQGKKEEKLDF
jgi:hypothetical protein